MKLSLRKIISEVISKAIDEIKLRKISIKLFSNSKDLGTFNITPIISSENPKIKKIFNESEIDEFELWSNDGERLTVICAEGILRYRYSDNSDYDGPDISETLEIDTLKDDEWNLIKERIKPILEQNDIDEAIREVGDLKKNKSQYKGDNKTFKQKLSDMGAKLENSFDGYYILRFNTGNVGLYTDRFYNIIPPLFDYITPEYKDKKSRTFEAVKGEYIFNLKRGKGSINILEKYPISRSMENYKKDLIKKYSKDVWEENENIKTIEKDIRWDIEMTIINRNMNKIEKEYWENNKGELIKYIIYSINIQQPTN